MTRSVAILATFALIALLSCGRGAGPELSTASASLPALPGEPAAEAMGGRSIIVTSADGAVSEEVVTFVGALPEVRGVEEIEIPPVVLSALAGAPETDGDSGLPSNVSLIVSSDDGSVQEEVVIVDEVGAADDEGAAALDGVLVASI